MRAIFHGSRLKVERAGKHVQDLQALMETFPAESDFHTVFIDKLNPKYGVMDLVVDIRRSGEDFVERAALIIGDAVHNLRSALDIMYCEAVKLQDTGKVTKWTAFPIRDSRDDLLSPLNEAVRKKQISAVTKNFILNNLRPYRTEGGNIFLWAVHDLDITDKHQLLIPAFQIMAISGIRLKNDKNQVIDFPTVFTDETCRVRIDEDVYGRNPTVEEKGRPAIGLGFQLRTPFQGDAVLPALHRIAEEVSRAIEAFDCCLRDSAAPRDGACERTSFRE